MSGARTTTQVELSEAAARRKPGILAKEAPGAVFRLGVDGGGCSGFKYSFAVDPAPGANDLLLEQGAARLVVDETSLAYLQGARVDFVDDLMGQAFRVENPNASSSCGCGVSFSV
ncbi:MAG: iron-sulfur cluster assembly accessory protein [Methylocystis sp.]